MRNLYIKYHTGSDLCHSDPPPVGDDIFADMSTSAPDFAGEQGTVLDRLIRAADSALRRDGVDNISIETVAAAAGVSRATAFRQLGGRDQMIVAVALWRSQRLAAECAATMSQHVGAFARLEAAFLYLIPTVTNDPVMHELFSMRTFDDLGPGGQEVALRAFGSAIEEGRAAGEIRTDASVDEIVNWITEQFFVAVRQHDRSEAALLRRVRAFLIPALANRQERATPGVVQSRIDTLESALNQATRALQALRAEVPADDADLKS